MGTKFILAVEQRFVLWMAFFGAVLLAAAHLRTAAAADEPAAGVTRTYDVNDLLWWNFEDDAVGGLRQGHSDDIIRLIKETVAPGSWKSPGGANTVEERDARLIVTASLHHHDLLAEMLRQFRESTAAQGVSLDCHFILADEAFVRRDAPAALGRKEPGASARGIGLLKARSIVEAARETPGVVVVPAPPLPLSSLPQSLLVGQERRLVLPRMGADKGATIEVSRPAGMSLAVDSVAGERHVTLDLTARSATLDVLAEADGKPGATDPVDEIEGLYRGTFAVERTGAFLIRAPLVRARLAGVREGSGADGQEVVREVAAAQSAPPRYLLVVGRVRPMTGAEVTLLHGAGAAKSLEEQRRGLVDEPEPLPEAGRVSGSTRVYNLRNLVLGSERGAARGPARAKRLERAVSRVKAAINDEKVPVRVVGSAVLVTGVHGDYAKIRAVLEEMSAERLLEPEAE